jgi:hypothetical protein
MAEPSVTRASWPANAQELGDAWAVDHSGMPHPKRDLLGKAQRLIALGELAACGHGLPKVRRRGYGQLGPKILVRGR